MADAWQALFGDANDRQAARPARARARTYPAWVLDQMGVEIMLANRVAMGNEHPAAAFPLGPLCRRAALPAGQLRAWRSRTPTASPSSRSKTCCAQRYLQDAGLHAPPATLAEYLARVVTPTLEAPAPGRRRRREIRGGLSALAGFDKVDRADADRIYPRSPASRPRPSRVQTAAGFPLPLHRRGMRTPGHGGASPHHGRRGRLLRRGRRQSPATRTGAQRSALRKTKFVMVHGGWPFTREITRAAHQAECLSRFLRAGSRAHARDSRRHSARVAGVRARESHVRHRRLPLHSARWAGRNRAGSPGAPDARRWRSPSPACCAMAKSRAPARRLAPHGAARQRQDVLYGL